MRSLLWCGPVFEPTGYADEVRGMVAAVANAGLDLGLRPMNRESVGFRETLTESHRRLLEERIAHQVTAPFVQLQHHTLDSFAPASEHAVYSIGRSMFETDGLPSHWVASANALDELWVTGDFNRDTFRAAGVRVPMHVIPGGIDSEFFHPGVHPLPLAGVRGTVFLSVFEWRLRKGWDVLLRAWAEAFSRDDDVTLVLRTYPIGKADARRNADVINERVDTFLRESCGRARADVAPIVILGDRVAARDLPALYRSAHAFVLPTRGEGWGRPFMESMACGVPVIATNWSAHLAFMNNANSYLVDVTGLAPADSTEVSVYAGQCWAEPSATHLATQLRRVHRDRDEARSIGERARRDMVSEWPWSRVADAITARLRAINAQLDRAASWTAPRGAITSGAITSGVVVEGGSGDTLQPHSNAFDWLQAVRATSDDVAGASARGAISWRTTDRGVRPSFSSERIAAWQQASTRLDRVAVHVTVLDVDGAPLRPTAPTNAPWLIDVGSTVAGGVPSHLVTTLRDQADLVVVPHTTARDACLAVGVDAARVAVVEPAIDTSIFTPFGCPYHRATTGGTRFLLLGGDRSHRDLRRTISLYERSFTADDDVVLHVVLPPPREHEDRSLRNRLMAESLPARRHPRLPRVFVDALGVDTDEMAALYRAADVLLHVGSGTGRGRTVREAMACGLPVIATALAPMAELLDDGCGWLVPHGTAGAADAETLRRVMHEATDRDLRAARGAEARARSLTWPLPSAQHAMLRDIVARVAHCTPRRRAGDDVPCDVQPFPLAGPRGVVVLAHADWHNGAAPAVVRAYAAAFSADDDVTLALCLDPAQGVSVDDAARVVVAAMDAAPREHDARPDLILVTDPLDASTLHRLRSAANVVVAVRDPIAAANARHAQRDVLESLDVASWHSVVARHLSAPQAA